MYHLHFVFWFVFILELHLYVFFPFLKLGSWPYPQYFTKCLGIFKIRPLLNVANIYLFYKLKLSAKLKKNTTNCPFMISRFLCFVSNGIFHFNIIISETSKYLFFFFLVLQRSLIKDSQQACKVCGNIPLLQSRNRERLRNLLFWSQSYLGTDSQFESKL